MTLRDYLDKAKKEKWAVGHFNFSTADQLKAIVEAAAELNSPVMVATSEGEADFFGRSQAVALVRLYQALGYAVFLNADHHKSWETALAAIDAGYDSILIDGSKLAFSENVELTKRVVDHAKKIGQERGIEITVEGELGYLRGDSEIQKNIEISQDDYTKADEAKDFVRLTGVDRLAIAFGNIHGIVTQQEEKLDIPRLKEIAAGIPDATLVLHGGSGLHESDIKEAIENGISNVHINTELRVAYQAALKDEINKEPGQTTPYKFLGPSFHATKGIVLEKIRLFGSVGKK